MRLLALESAGPRCSVALLEDGVVVAQAARDGAMGHASALPELLADILGRQMLLDAVAVGIGPGGFTGVRTGIALAHGVALARGVPLLGVSTGQALAAEAAPGGRAIWAALDSKRGHLFLERPGYPAQAFAERDLPRANGPVLIIGDGAARAVARLLARGEPAALGAPLLAHAVGVGLAAWAMLQGDLPRGTTEPLYIDPPATK